jgi:23S rRNA (uracil1939-C5)-methyltransferase
LRDLYEVKTVIPFDMFPNTPHVETVVLMSKK